MIVIWKKESVRERIEEVAYEMRQYRLLALDLDGTLLNEHGEVSEMNAIWIKHAIDAGVTVCASTGRGFQGAIPIVERLGLDSPMITVNGGEVWSKPHSLHKRTTLDSDKVIRLHEVALKHPDVWFWAYSTEGLFNKDGWTDEPASKVWLKFGYYSEELSLLEEILKEIGVWDGLEITNSSPNNIEVNPQGVSKASGLMELCRLKGLDMSEIVSVGDSLNDIAAIRASGLGVAMGNAQDEVKMVADVITGTNEEDGVAQVIQQYVLRT